MPLLYAPMLCGAKAIDGEPAVAELQEVVRRGVRPALLVDADRRLVSGGPAIEDDDRQAALLDDQAALVVEGVAVGDEPVDDGRAHDVDERQAGAAAGDDHERHAGLVAGLGDAAQHEQGRRIGEGDRQGLLDQTDGADPPAAQRAGQWVWPGVPELAWRRRGPARASPR